jgi:putative ABC transport system permease protein
MLYAPVPTEISVEAIALAIGVSGGIGLFFGVIPAQQAARLELIVALRINRVGGLDAVLHR